MVYKRGMAKEAVVEALVKSAGKVCRSSKNGRESFECQDMR